MLKENELILIGFGKHDLKDMLKWIDTDREVDLREAWVKWPARYREFRICTPEEVTSCMQYLAYALDLVKEWEDDDKRDKNK